MNSKLPEGWTDDMNIVVGNGRTQRDVAECVLEYLKNGALAEEIHAGLTRTFSLTCDDADLALDRARGGIVRALTGNMSNAPNANKDPIARYAFDLVWATFPRKGFFSMGRIASGPWVDWHRKSS